MSRARIEPETPLADGSVDVSPEAIAKLVSAGVAALSAPTRDPGISGSASEREAINGVMNLTHDMRSPISSMLVLIERLRRGQSGPVTPAQEQQLNLLFSATFELASITNDAFDIARDGTAQRSANNVEFSIAEVMRSVQSAVQPIAEARALRMRWSVSGHDRVEGDRTALHRVLLNLSTNSLKNTCVGCIDISAVRGTAEHVTFTVRDTGTGFGHNLISEGTHAKLGGDALASSGTGLGLAICTKLVREMRGSFSICNNSDVGATCQFTIPLPAVN